MNGVSKSKNLVLKAAIMASLFSFLGCGKKNKPYETAEIYDGLRGRLFKVQASDLKLERNGTEPEVWGVVMETGMPEGVSTLVALGDETVSLYLSTGGGYIGVGEHEGPKKVSMELISLCQSYIDKLGKTDVYPLPQRGHVRFYLLTYDGNLTAEVEEKVLQQGRHELSQLFMKGHELISELIQAVESSEKAKSAGT